MVFIFPITSGPISGSDVDRFLRVGVTLTRPAPQRTLETRYVIDNHFLHHCARHRWAFRALDACGANTSYTTRNFPEA